MRRLLAAFRNCRPEAIMDEFANPRVAYEEVSGAFGNNTAGNKWDLPSIAQWAACARSREHRVAHDD